jgi:hypothetical protein
MTNAATKSYQVAVIERAIAYYEVEAEDARTAAENWSDGEFIYRDDEALDTEGPCSVREQQPDGTWRKVPKSEWEEEAVDADPAKNPYSVLLLYPDHANDGGTETYYAFVEAPDPLAAIAIAQQRALSTNEWNDVDPNDFAPLLVTQGHHYGEALFNK